MNNAGWDEPELVRRCKEGQEAAYAELVRRHRPRLYSLAIRLTGQRETAEDVVQEAFMAAFRTIERFEPRPSLSAWLNTILIRGAGRAAERSEARSGASLDALLDGDARLLDDLRAAHVAPEHDPAAAAEAAELRTALADAIDRLPFRYRAAVVTRFVLGMDYAEAAASLDTGLNTYKSHLLRGTRMLREALSSQRGIEAEKREEPAVRHDARAPAMDRGSAPATALSAAGAGGLPGLQREERLGR